MDFDGKIGQARRVDAVGVQRNIARTDERPPVIGASACSACAISCHGPQVDIATAVERGRAKALLGHRAHQINVVGRHRQAARTRCRVVAVAGALPDLKTVAKAHQRGVEARRCTILRKQVGRIKADTALRAQENRPVELNTVFARQIDFGKTRCGNFAGGQCRQTAIGCRIQ